MPAVRATLEMRGDHPQLELGQLVVEPQRNLLANALADQWTSEPRSHCV